MPLHAGKSRSLVALTADFIRYCIEHPPNPPGDQARPVAAQRKEAVRKMARWRRRDWQTYQLDPGAFLRTCRASISLAFDKTVRTKHPLETDFLTWPQRFPFPCA